MQTALNALTMLFRSHYSDEPPRDKAYIPNTDTTLSVMYTMSTSSARGSSTSVEYESGIPATAIADMV